MMPARELPVLPAEKNIVTGILENGIRYYLAANSVPKGWADIAVVRKGEIPSEVTASQMKSLPGFSRTAPLDFLRRNGIGAGEEGYFEERDGSTVFRFVSVPMYHAEVADSTLLLAFSLISASSAPQAIIISGDIVHDELLRKMRLFSMLVPSVGREALEDDYVWEPHLSPSFTLKTLRDTDEALVSVAYFAPRTPRKYMATAQPLVLDIFAREFTLIVKDRLNRQLRSSRIPYSHIGVDYVLSGDTAGDLKYTISVGTDREHIDLVMETVSRTVSSLATFGVSKEDFEDARQALAPVMRHYAQSVPSRGDYLDRCLRSFLYGTSLAARGESYRIFNRRTAVDTVGVAFFNRMSASFLNPSCNADIRYEAPVDTLDDLEAFFRYNLNYLKGSMMDPTMVYQGNRADTAGLDLEGGKVKIRKESVDPVTGGTLWILSNGFKVIYNRDPGREDMDYTFLWGKGYAATHGGIQRGEGGFYTDLLRLYNVGDLGCDAFYAMLSANGIEFNPEVDAAGTTLRGSAPWNRFPLLLRAVVALFHSSSPSPVRYEEYCIGERLRLTSRREAPYRVERQLYDALHTDGLSPYKDPACLQPSLLGKADDFFRQDLFPSASDGVLILSGDMEPSRLRKILCRYLGALRGPGGVAPARNPWGETAGGRHVLKGEDCAGRIAMQLECEFPLTCKNFYLAGVLEQTVRRSIVAAAGDKVGALEVTCHFRSFPQERLVLELKGSSRDAGAPDAILSALSQPALLTGKDLEGYKAAVLSEAESSMKRPDGLRDLAVYRYLYGKDLKTACKENINSITIGDVTGALSALLSSGMAEYMGNGK